MWEYFRSNPEEDVYVGIWRNIGGSRNTLVAKTRLSATQSGTVTVTLLAPIAVQKGDFIGIHYRRIAVRPAIPNSRGIF